MGQVDSKVAIVTGGGSGIGAACAVTPAREGAKVAVTISTMRAAGRSWTRSAAPAAKRSLSSVDAAHRAGHGVSDPIRSIEAYTPNVKRLPVFQSTSCSGISARTRAMKFRPVQCIGTTTSGASPFSSAIVCST